jgi:hypothetical protein
MTAVHSGLSLVAWSAGQMAELTGNAMAVWSVVHLGARMVDWTALSLGERMAGDWAAKSAAPLGLRWAETSAVDLAGRLETQWEPCWAAKRVDLWGAELEHWRAANLAGPKVDASDARWV